MAPKNKSLVALEGFNEGIIINYQKDSNLMRREATAPIKEATLQPWPF